MSSNSNTTRSSDVVVKLNGEQCKKEKNVIEVPTALDYLFEKELIKKQNKHMHLMDTFGPSRNTYHVAAKFYARHDQHMLQNYKAFVPFVYGSAYKQETEANVYGWMPQRINKTNLLKELNFVQAPKVRCCLTVYGEKLESDKENARPSFNGLRFFLQ